MKNRKQHKSDTPLVTVPQEGMEPMPLSEIARHIAILVVHQHRRREAGEGKKTSDTTL